MDRSALPAASISVPCDHPTAGTSSSAVDQNAPARPPVKWRPPPLEDARTSQILAALLKLLPYENALQQWSSADGANARLFRRNPLEAAASANLDLPPTLLEELRAVSSLIGGPSHR